MVTVVVSLLSGESVFGPDLLGGQCTVRDLKRKLVTHPLASNKRIRLVHGERELPNHETLKTLAANADVSAGRLWVTLLSSPCYSLVTWGHPCSGGDSRAVVTKLMDGVTSVFNTHNAFAALKEGGELVTWGDPEEGGDSSAVAAKLKSAVTTVCSTGSAFAALKVGGAVITWGSEVQ